MRHGRIGLALVAALLVGGAVWTVARQPEPDELTAEEAKEKAIADRFRKVLDTNPRRGTALDRLYGYHVERGTLDKLIAEYAARAKDDPKAGMVVGLLEAQRGKDAAAVAAFRQATTADATNPIAPYYLGQSLVLVGQPDGAAVAFEQALTRNPARNDLLDIYQALGRVYQRSQRPEKALEVWARLEKQFPDDPRVQEQIAAALVDEGQFEQALPRLQKLADATEDKYRQSTLRMDVADLKVKLKKSAEALTDFEKLLSELNPDSWLYRDVRRRIEDVFLKNDDFAGLSKYYESWLAKNPTDVDAVARLAKTLASQGRGPEARDWLKKGVEVAPANRALRQALVDQFVAEQNFAEAAVQYEAMDKADPNNPDILREWGRLLMRDTVKPEAQRQAAASAVWRRMLEKKPNDPVTAAQVADLLRGANAAEDAIALYRRAIELAPTAAQYREYLGEYLHTLKRGDEALATWRPIAEGANRNSKNLARLAEVFAGFGYRKEAVQAMSDAVALERDDFTLLMTYAELLSQDSQYDAALKQIDAASRVTSNPEEVEQILVAQIKVYQATETLPDKIDELQKQLDAGTEPTADRWLRLARYYEANRQADKATVAIAAAGEKDPKSVPVLIAAARINESGGNLLAAADLNRKLAAIDRRFRTEYLTQVAKLEQRLGRRTEALQAGRDLLAASPGNPDVYKYFSDLCFQLGEQEEGLEALRRSVRANPSEPSGLVTLANALGERTRQGEAIELLWRAFEKTPDLEGRLGVVERLTQLYLEANQFDRLMERLERERREADKTREMTMCVAQAYTTAGDLGTARLQLERLLTENTRDTNLLSQLSTLCEQEGDIPSAVKFQRQLNVAAPNSYDHQLRLAALLIKAGEPQEAADIWVKLVSNDPEPHRSLQTVDGMVTAGKADSAVAVLSRLLAQKPGNWELLYREGAVLAARGRPDEAAVRFQAVLAQKLPDDERGEVLKHEIAQAEKKKKSANPNANRRGMPIRTTASPDSYPPLLRRTQNLQNIRMACGMENQERYYGGQQQPFYAPADFGEARMACLAWLYELARAKDQGDAYLKGLRTAKEKAGPDPRPQWDWYYLQTVRQNTKETFPAALALSRSAPNPASDLAFLTALSGRAGTDRVYRRRGTANADKTPPLPPDQLTYALDCFARLKRQKPEWASNVTPYILTELKRAKRETDEKAMYDDMVAAATTAEKVQEALQYVAGRGDTDASLALFAKLEQLQGPAKTSAIARTLPTRQQGWTLVSLMDKKAEEKKPADVLRVADVYLASARKLNLSAPPAASTSRRSGNRGGFYVSVGGRYNQMTFPSPNEYYDEGSLQILYTAFDRYKAADLLSDLFAHYRKQSEAAQGGEAVYYRLALGYMHWWAEEKDEALEHLTAAVGLVPNDHDLTIEVAGLREQANDPAAALALLDSITPTDHNVMLRREEAALRVAERTGNVERARTAADRLFGLRLDPDKQLELAGQMHRLGMHKEAEAVVARAQRQAGNKTAVLVRLMTQYQSQNQPDQAVALARQILRKLPASAPQNPRYGGNENDSYRSAAIGVLARSGQLKDVIERAEAQLKASPRSVVLNQTLLAYYQAAGDKPKQLAIVKMLASLKPDDGNVRFDAAQKLQELGDRDAAIAEYKAAIRLAPARFSDRYWEIVQIFSQADKFEELAAVMDEIDMRKLSYYWSATEVITPLLENEKTKPIGMKLFKKAWDAFPTNRASLLSQISRDEVWRRPEIYDYARQAVIPRSDGEIDPWAAAVETTGYSANGQTTTVMTRLLSVARKQQRLPELRAEAEAALAARPDWHAGKALIAIIDIQTGQKERGLKAWVELFDGPNGAEVPPLARFVLTQELEYYAGTEAVAVRTLEAGLEAMLEDENQEFNSNPAKRLAWWYEQTGRTEDVKKLYRRFAAHNPVNPGYSGGYWEYRLATQRLAVAQTLQQAGDVVGAVQVYNQLLADRDSLLAGNRYYGGERFDVQAEEGLRAAMKAIKPSALPSAVGAVLTPPAKPAEGQPVLDFVLAIESRELVRTSVGSLVASLLTAAGKNEAVRAEAAGKLAALAKAHPDDLSVLSAVALLAFAGDKPDATREAVERLAAAVEKAPLEPLPVSGKPNARQRTVAQGRLPIWLVARECLRNDKAREPLRPAGEKLAAAALAAARRVQDTGYAIAVLREWGQLDLDRGDKASAEARWSELLELALPKPKKENGRQTNAAAEPRYQYASLFVPADEDDEETEEAAGEEEEEESQVPVPAAPVRPAAPAGAAPKPAGTVVTAEQFQEAYQVARLAVERGIPLLSVKAMSEALKGGPPAPPKRDENRGGGMLYNVTVNGQNYYSFEDPNGPKKTGVSTALLDLVPKWKAKGVPPADVYQLLAAAVLPDARPAEVFLYSDVAGYGQLYTINSSRSLVPVNDVVTGDGFEDRGVAGLLAEAAVAAGKADDLRARLESRLGRPLGEVPARVVLLTLALKQGDDARAGAILTAFAEKAEKDPTQATLDACGAAARSALSRPALAKQAEDMMLKLSLRFATGNNLGKAEAIGQQLVDHHLSNRNYPAAKKLIDMAATLGKQFSANNPEVHRRAAEMYVRAGYPDEALGQYGLHADLTSAAQADPTKRARRQEPTVERFDVLVRLLLGMPADKRYAALSKWSLPTAGRKSVRYFIGTSPVNVPPPAFGPVSGVPAGEYISTMLLLADAAKESGKADELTAAADKLAAEKIDNADTLRVLVYLRLGKGTAITDAVKAYAKAARDRMTAKDKERVGSRYYYDDDERQPIPVHPSEYLFVTLCRTDPNLALVPEPLLGPMLDRARGTHSVGFVPRVFGVWDRLGAARAGAADALDTPSARPAGWNHITNSDAFWFAQDGYLTGWAENQNNLLFDTPLAGTFEFSVDCYQGNWAQGHIGYGGVVFEPNRSGVESRLFAVRRAENDAIRRAAPGLREGEFNRLTVQAAPDKVRYLLNGQLVYEDTAPPPTSPWLMLYAGPGRRPVFRNPTLTGTPTVPAEVPLLVGDYLDGWSSHVYGANLPQRLTAKEEKPKEENTNTGRRRAVPAADAPPPVYDWTAKGGELAGRKNERSGTLPVPSRLMYFRPLRPGEAVRYEFFHEPGQTMVHPSLGRLAFVVDSAGVKARWLVDNVRDDWTGLTAENDTDDPAARKGNPVLKANDWNTAALSVTADAVRVEVNGSVVYEAPIPAGLERTFGFYHDRNRTAVRVRNVVLAGPWPKTFDPKRITFDTAPESPQVAKARRWQLGERYYFTEASDVASNARGLSPIDRYAALAAWVLPTPARPSFQLAGAFTPRDVLGTPEPADGRRVLLGGRLDIPAVELVAAAEAAGKLDELADRLTKFAPTDPVSERGKAALLALTRAAQGKTDEANELLKKLAGQTKALSVEANPAERWPTAVALAGCVDRPAVRAAAVALSDAFHEKTDQAMLQNKTYDDKGWWERVDRFLHARLHADPARPFGAAGFAHWAPLSNVSPWGRTQGYGVPHWEWDGQVLTHRPGHDEDFLVLRSPLRGNFEITCDFHVLGWSEADLLYGGLRIAPNHEFKKAIVISARGERRELGLEKPIPDHRARWYAYKLAVKDGVLTASVDGIVIASEKVGPNADPWLMLHAYYMNTAPIRNLAITGDVSIPKSVDLLADDGLVGWRGYYGGAWAMRGEEMFHGGTPVPDDPDPKPRPRGYPEAAAFYHRPLLEDGAVEYEWFHEPGKADAHPALDRLVFLLDPDGVKLHQLTDGPRERSGTGPANEAVEADRRKGPSKLPLKPKAWNRCRLEVKGDTVLVSVNGTLVYERPIPPTNQRTFGVFHYTDRGEARVRAMTLTGDWPTSLPAKGELFAPGK